MVDMTTGRAPASHGPIYSNPRGIVMCLQGKRDPKRTTGGSSAVRLATKHRRSPVPVTAGGKWRRWRRLGRRRRRQGSDRHGHGRLVKKVELKLAGGSKRGGVRGGGGGKRGTWYIPDHSDVIPARPITARSPWHRGPDPNATGHASW